MNGSLTETISTEQETHQGGPLSPLLFILATESLATKIRQDTRIKGINRKIQNLK